ncbi:hypothetical protein MLD52_04410 [Puniceicoccaceae bacterium K14]|nr:hypothetical protein [Puniceicoccaceae bacterium K14]
MIKFRKKGLDAFRRVWFLNLICLLLAGCSTMNGGLDPEKALIPRFVFEELSNEGYANLAILPISDVRIPVKNEASISEYDILDVSAVDTEYGKCLQFNLTPAASRDFYRESVSNQGRRLVLLVNGKAMGVRRVDGANDSGTIYIFAEIAEEDLVEYAKEMKGTILEIRKRLD